MCIHIPHWVWHRLSGVPPFSAAVLVHYAVHVYRRHVTSEWSKEEAPCYLSSSQLSLILLQTLCLLLHLKTVLIVHVQYMLVPHSVTLLQVLKLKSHLPQFPSVFIPLLWEPQTDPVLHGSLGTCTSGPLKFPRADSARQWCSSSVHLSPPPDSLPSPADSPLTHTAADAACNTTATDINLCVCFATWLQLLYSGKALREGTLRFTGGETIHYYVYPWKIFCETLTTNFSIINKPYKPLYYAYTLNFQLLLAPHVNSVTPAPSRGKRVDKHVLAGFT